MDLQEFYYKTNIYKYLLRKEVRAAALIYPVDLEIIQELTYPNRRKPPSFSYGDIRRVWRICESN